MKRWGRRWPKTMSVSVLGADTNVLVRYFTRDDAVQSPQTRQLLSKPGNQPIRICIIALVELVWVLTKVKRWPMVDVFALCRGLMQSADFDIEEDELVALALDDAEVAGCDLADALIALMNARAGCESTATFDENAQRLERMIPVEQRL